jgi:hypothetical protein
LRAEQENAFDSMRFSRESLSNEIDEDDLQFGRHDEKRISGCRGTVVNMA